MDERPSPLLSLDSFGVKTASGWTSPRVSTELRRGESLAWVGRAGSGKTLILEQLARVFRPAVEPVGKMRVGKFAWVPQDARLAVLPTDRVWTLVGLSGMSVRLRQAMGTQLTPSADENRAIELMKRLRLDADRIAELPFRELSATERRCVLLTRALLSNPEVLALDGWDEQMDGSARRAIGEILTDFLRAGGGLILSSRRYPLPDFRETRTLSLSEADGADAPVPLLQKAPVQPPHEHVLLEVNRLTVQRRRVGILRRRPPAYLIDGASLYVRHGESLVLLGTAGSGKTTLLQAIAGLGAPSHGTIRVEGNDVTQARGRRARRLRRQVQLVFQDAAAVLDGYRTVQAHLEEAMSLRKGQKGSPGEWLERLGLSPRLLRAPADQLSASEGQRVDLARSLVVEPRLILLDAPEVSGAAEDGGVFSALVRSEKAHGRAFLIATSSAELARSLGDRVAIFHAGRVVELGTAKQVLERPGHPLTRALVQGESLPVHDPTAPSSGCPFVGRCNRRQLPQCDEREPMLAPLRTSTESESGPESDGGRRAACFYPIVD